VLVRAESPAAKAERVATLRPLYRVGRVDLRPVDRRLPPAWEGRSGRGL